MPRPSSDRIRLGRLTLGSRVRAVRVAGGVSLADAARAAGISYSYLSDVERGRRLPTMEVLDALAASLDQSVTTLLSGLYPWDVSDVPPDVGPPPDGRRRPDS